MKFKCWQVSYYFELKYNRTFARPSSIIEFCKLLSSAMAIAMAMAMGHGPWPMGHGHGHCPWDMAIAMAMATASRFVDPE
jgi:hypothetical protein